MNNKGNICPVCKNTLIPFGNKLSIDEIFSFWAPIQFPYELIEKHAEQSRYTQKYKCSRCDLEIFLPKIIGNSEFYEYLAKYESASYYEDIKWDFKEAAVEVNKGDEVIEIGCGPGNFLTMIKSTARVAIGTEFNKIALKQAQEKGHTVFGADKDIEKLKGRFDKVFAFHVLEHVEDPIGFIEYLFEFIKESGRVCLTVPNQNGPLKYIHPCVHNMPPHHATIWSRKTFKYLAERMDLSIARLHHEPLNENDSYYYTVHFANFHIKPDSRLKRLLNRGLSKTIKVILLFSFKILSKFSIHSIPFLKSQSIYISLRKRKQ